MHMTGKEKTLAAKRVREGCASMVEVLAVSRGVSGFALGVVCTKALSKSRLIRLTSTLLLRVSQPGALFQKASPLCLHKSCAIQRCGQAGKKGVCPPETRHSRSCTCRAAPAASQLYLSSGRDRKSTRLNSSHLGISYA